MVDELKAEAAGIRVIGRRPLLSMRMNFGLDKLEDSLSLHTTGQSGHAFYPNYVDMDDHWHKIEYQPMI